LAFHRDAERQSRRIFKISTQSWTEAAMRCREHSVYHDGLEDEHSKPQRYPRVPGQLGILIIAAS
jgi:hypothetical protein